MSPQKSSGIKPALCRQQPLEQQAAGHGLVQSDGLARLRAVQRTADASIAFRSGRSLEHGDASDTKANPVLATMRYKNAPASMSSSSSSEAEYSQKGIWSQLKTAIASTSA
jgi:hypothetical protein